MKSIDKKAKKSTDKKAINLLIVDDLALVRTSLKYLLDKKNDNNFELQVKIVGYVDVSKTYNVLLEKST